MASTLKLIDELRHNSGLHVGRMLEDGMPFRGPHMQLREEEYEELTEVTYDSSTGLFDIMDPEQKAKLSQIIDRAVNGWYVVHSMSREPHFTQQPDGTTKALIYCVWSVPHRQLNMQRAEALGPPISSR